MEEYLTDCYNINNHIMIGNHDDPNLIAIAHVEYIYLPSNPNTRVEIIIKDHDNINNPAFYILTEDRRKELYKVPLFNNNIEGLSKEDKKALNAILRTNFRYNWHNASINTFKDIKNLWISANDIPEELEEKYSNMPMPYYE